MNGVKYLVGDDKILYTGIRAFSNDICGFLADLSAALMRNRKAAAYADIISFAYFCRKSGIERIKQKYGEEIRFGRGLAFHIAPSNIPINFAFSFVFGLLSGNSNIVRVSSKTFEQTEIVCGEIAKVIKNYPRIACRNAIITYEADDEINRHFSEIADVRVIWGGDKTVSYFKSLPCGPRCVDIAFSDRYSIGIIDGNAVAAASDAKMRELADAFYNDTYLMDQNACSSPQIIFWRNADKTVKERFWSCVESTALKKYSLEAENAVNKYVCLCKDIINSDSDPKCVFENNILYRVEYNSLPSDITALRGLCGYFYEYDIADIADIFSYVTPKFQTMCYFGFERSELKFLIESSELGGIDRIVPFGKSLDIKEIWDGYDIIRSASRVVDIE